MDLKENRLSIIIEDIISEGQIDIKSLSKKLKVSTMTIYRDIEEFTKRGVIKKEKGCLLYTSPSPRDLSTSRMPSSA